MSNDAIVESYLRSQATIAGLNPAGRFRLGRDGTTLVNLGVRIPTLNGVRTRNHRPDLAEVERLAGMMAEQPLPWSMQFRGRPSPDAAALAARFGLTAVDIGPIMTYERSLGRPSTAVGTAAVRKITSADREVFVATAAAGFGIPVEIMAELMTATLLDLPESAAYLAEEDGEPVAAAYGLRDGDYINVEMIATVPGRTRRGFGRLITARVMADAFDDGASIAYLRSTTAGFPLYESMGFSTYERWTYFLA